MRKIIGLTVSFVLAAALSGGVSAQNSDSPERIVSLAPSITEILFNLGLGESIVGVTRYCKYPPEAGDKEIIGGVMDVNVERLITLKPDLILGLPSLNFLERRLNALGLAHRYIKTENLSDIFSAMLEIGRETGTYDKAKEIENRIRADLFALENILSGVNKKRVTVVVERSRGSVSNVVVAGGGTFLDDLVQVSGAENPVKEYGRGYMRISKELLLAMDPDIIIDLTHIATEMDEESQIERIRGEWDELGVLRAVRDKKVYVLSDEIFIHPGPRVAEAARTLARLFYPEVFSDLGEKINA